RRSDNSTSKTWPTALSITHRHPLIAASSSCADFGTELDSGGRYWNPTSIILSITVTITTIVISTPDYSRETYKIDDLHQMGISRKTRQETLRLAAYSNLYLHLCNNY